MTIGRSNSEASDTRSSVSWKVDRVPNSGRNCLGRTSREAGHSRVPAPPHMIRGIILWDTCELLKRGLYAVIISIPFDKATQAIRQRRRGREADVALQGRNVGTRLEDVASLHRQKRADRRLADDLLQCLDELDQID